jgi:hypothetical protein
MSFFKRDLNKEKILTKYLDDVYGTIPLPIQRIDDLDLQYKGVDLIYKNGKHKIYIDEKAQLDYLNADLPTFTFELSYLKEEVIKIGWFLDASKITDYYFLITGIYVNDENNISKGINNCKITSVNRFKLLQFLDEIGLTNKKLSEYNDNIRSKNVKTKKTAINELYEKTQGCIIFSEHLNEKPINLMLRLDFLIKNGIARRVYPINLKHSI